MRLFKLFRNRKKRIAVKQYKAGYDYAAGMLLRAETTPLGITHKLFFSGYNYFDQGCQDAVDYIVNLGICTDDRI